MTRAQIDKQIKQIEAKMRAMDHDEYGVAVDREAGAALTSKLEELEGMTATDSIEENVVRLKPLSQMIRESKEKDESPEAIHAASEISLLDKAKKNVKAGDEKKDTKQIEKKRTQLADKYKKITGHNDVAKSIPEAKMQRTVSIYEGLLEDLEIKDFKEFGRKYGAQIKALVADIGGQYVGYFYDAPTKTIAIATDQGVGKYYYDQASGEFDDYQIMSFYK